MLKRNESHDIPDLLDFSEYVKNPLWNQFIENAIETYRVQPFLAFSKCSWEYGWHIKLKKGSRTWCTLYPREYFFTVMIVIGKKEKDKLEAIFPSLSLEMQHLVEETKEANGQRWLMIDCEDENRKYNDMKRILEIRV